MSYYSYFLRQTVGRRKILSLPGNTQILFRWLRTCTCLDSSWKSSKRTCATASLILVTRINLFFTYTSSLDALLSIYIIMKRIISIKQMSRLETRKRERENRFSALLNRQEAGEDRTCWPHSINLRMDGRTDRPMSLNERQTVFVGRLFLPSIPLLLLHCCTIFL